MNFHQSITGTLVNYFFHCKRQCWLFANRINLEDNSEDVHIGRVLHEIDEQKHKKAELSIDNIKIDRLTDEYLTEFKKSDSDIEAAKWQLILYLKKLKDKGIERKGKLEFYEANKQDKKQIAFELTDDLERDLQLICEKITSLISSEAIPPIEKDPKCNKCAYYEFCYL
jgi:CRISPR-associated exonuclease Cas4